MRSSRLYAAKLNSMPKLEFAISESPTSLPPPPSHRALPTRSFVSSCSSTHPFAPLYPSVPHVAYLWYRSQIQSRDSRADVSHARGMPQSSVPKCEVDSRAGVDCRIPREGSSLSPPSLFLSFFSPPLPRSLRTFAGNRSRRPVGYRPGRWRPTMAVACEVA